ncbi:hypothetical protein QBC40DRAFT_162501 [Triangularia verruculosa]|uniref:Ecp2 effector protein-like domain-containing protein n=1 Tax=Triangularia verruculosa TaxID=2587418 RepID=A0AAN7B205_9PEZI|nr:hypothetical protein QBC40DRAFT_162501 [Triangularia verruculosa]
MQLVTTILSLFATMAMAAPSFHTSTVSSGGPLLEKRFSHTPDPSKTNLCGEAVVQYRTSELSPNASDCWEIPNTSPANNPGYWTLDAGEAASKQWYSLGKFGTCEFKIRGNTGKSQEFYFGTQDIKFFIDAHTREGYDEEGRIEVAGNAFCMKDTPGQGGGLGYCSCLGGFW